MNDLVSAYVAHLRAGGCSPATLRLRAQLLARLDAELPYGIERAGVDELNAWLGRPGWARWTRYTYYEGLAAFFGWATQGRYPHLDWNPVSELHRPRIPRGEPKPASEDQVAIAMRLPRPWRTAILLAAFDGLRCAEIAGLLRSEITAEYMTVHRKGGKVMELPTHPAVWDEVAQLPAGPVVARPLSGRAYHPDALSKSVSRALTRAGLEDLTLHWFRHRFATVMLTPLEVGGGGQDIRTVQELLGHESVASTQMYTRVTSRQRRHAVTTLPVPSAPLSQVA